MRKALIAGLIPFFLFTFAVQAGAFWIWTPKKAKLESPKRAVKPTPEEQLAWAITFFESGDYERALREMKNLLSKYPASKEAAEAQYYIGRCYEALEDYYAAFKAYESVIARYPNSQRTSELIEREYRIGNLFFSGKKRKIAGLELLPSFDKAIEVFSRVMDQSPGPYAVLAQYKLAESYKKSKEYAKAKEAFGKLIENFPASELVDEARYQIALVSFQESRGVSYDDQATDEAIVQFSRFIKEHPENDLVVESQQAIETLRDRKAQKAYDIAMFYENQGNATAAKIYYDGIIEQYGKSRWAQMSLERLTILQKRAAKP